LKQTVNIQNTTVSTGIRRFHRHTNVSTTSWREQVNCQWDDDDEVRFVLDQYA